MTGTVPEFRKYNANKRRRDQWLGYWRDIYELAIPNRDLTSDHMEGARKHGRVYDSTAVDSTGNFANFVQSTMVPADQWWVNFVAGSDIPDELKPQANALLSVVQQEFFNLLSQTNFDDEVNEAFHDLAVGTCSMLTQDYDDEQPAVNSAVPSPSLVFVEGPNGSIWGTFRDFSKTIDVIKHEWPGAEIPQETARIMLEKPDEKIKLLESCLYNPNKRRWDYKIFLQKDEKQIFGDEHDTNPWSHGRWSKVPGEIYGRGPLINALPDIKTLNAALELILQNATIAISGVYTAADDGVLDPEEVVIEPGAVIPVGFNGGVNGRSLDALPRSGDFDLGNIVIEDLRQSIKRKLQDDIMDPLDQAVRSAEEVRDRAGRRVEQVPQAFGRVETEFVKSLIARHLDIFQKAGRLPPFNLDGREVDIKFVSPLAQLQARKNLQDLVETNGVANSIFPGLGMVMWQPGKLVEYITEQTGIPPQLTNNEEMINQLIASGMEAQAQGEDVVGPASRLIQASSG
tara:strand:- start:3709 stop:5250 length:1542 start_codon:yes stop_codon:yes gene_type:complete